MEHNRDYGLYFHGELILMQRIDKQFILPLRTIDSPLVDLENTSNLLFLGEFNHQQLHAAYIHPDQITNHPDLVLTPARDILVTITDASLSKLLCRAKQLLTWHRSSLFCGQCGAPTRLSTLEMCKLCDGCNAMIYPSTSPAIIVLIRREEEILLARSPHFQPSMYSTLAGFVDASESCEETIVREVDEEVGLQIKNIRYFGSQAWPFPNSFMIGFQADYASGEICINPNEIEDAQWFNQHNLPLLPPPYSIARQMIEAFLASLR